MSESRLSGRELFLIFFFWTALATLSAAGRLLDPRGFGFRMSPAAPILMTFIESWIWAAVTPLIFVLSRRFTLARVPLLLLIGLLISAGVYLLVAFARHEIFDVRRGFNFGRYGFLNQFLTCLAVFAAGVAREYFIRDQQRGREAITLEAQLADARLDALRMQLNPHFLFNTLHAISALVERDPSGVRKMIARLSELLRHTIDPDAPNEVTLRDELGFIRRYIEIMQIRFEGKLRVETDIDDATLDARVPNLILQPLVENAFEHGKGFVGITARRDGEQLVLAVRDNGPGPSDAGGKGVGLTNTHARLEAMYHGAASLSLSSHDEGGAVATIVVPFNV